MGTASAKPDKLHAFVVAAAEIRRELSSRITELRASYDAFQTTGSPVANPDVMDVELPGLLANYELDENFVAVTRRAFLDANTGVDGATLTVDEAALDTAFAAAAVAMGFDPATLTVPRAAVTVDEPVAAGTPQTSGFVADPVCTATGHFLEVEDDFTFPERLDVLRWRRTYSSRFVAGGPFGRGWASWASAGLVPDDDGTVGYQGPDGQLVVFVPSLAADDPPGSYAVVPGLAARLVRLAPGNGHEAAGWELRWERHSSLPGVVWTFDHEGVPHIVDDPARGRVTFTHAGGLLVAVEHAGGRRLDVDWDGARIVQVRSSCGRVSRYHYDAEGDLVRTERVLGDRRYETDGRGRIVEVWDADGVRLCRNTFDDDGRVLTQVSPFGRETTFAYHQGNRTVVSDTEGGPVNIYEHDPAGRLTGLVEDRGHVLRRVFDDAGRVVAANGFDSTTTRQEFAADGLSASRVGAGGVTESWRYDEAGRVVAHATEGGPELRFEYADDAAVVPSRLSGPFGWEIVAESHDGLVTALTDADGVTLRYEHDADGSVVATTNGLGASVRSELHASGMATRVVQPDGSVTEFDRDDAGRMLAVRTPDRHELTIEWTAAGRLAGVVTPDEGHTAFEHGAHGAVERIVDAVGATVDLTHDHLERLVGVAGADGAKWELGYSALGLLSLVHDPAGGTWSYDHDAEGRLVAATNPVGSRVRNVYDAAGRLAEQIDPAGNATRLTRDALGRVTRVDEPEGATTTCERDVWGRPVTVRHPDGETVTTTYSPAGRPVSAVTSEGRGWTATYDAAGRLATLTDAAGATTRYVWDVCDRLVETTSAAGRVTRWGYDHAGRVTATTVAGHTHRATYDHAGRLTTTTDPSGATRRYAYDLRGKLVSATDPLGHTVQQRYDRRGDVSTVVDPFGGVTTTEYDGMRRPVAHTDQLGRTTRIRRDAAGRVVAREMPTGDVLEWRRDARGLATDVRVDGLDVVVFDHDAAGRPVLVHEPGRNRTLTLAWTRGGRLAALDVDGATMRWERDGDGLVVARHDPAGRRTSYTHDRAGRLVATASGRWGAVELDRDLDGHLVALRADGVERRWDHDAGGLVARYRETAAGVARTTDLTRDGAGRIVEVRTGDGVTRYGYDAAGQLVSAVTPSGAWTWTYDEAGRLVAEDGPDGSTEYAYDEAHQLVRMEGPGGTTGFSYDAAGRRTGEEGPAGTRAFTWDALDRLTSVSTPGGARREVDVDALGRLVAYGDTTFTWDPTGIVPDLVAIDEREMVVADGQTVASVARGGDVGWLSADWQGTLAVPGAGVDRDAWGAGRRDDDVAGGGGADRAAAGFLGALELDGLVWLHHRTYDPRTRQFTTRDPVAGVAGTSVAANPYHYGGNDPVGHVDPLGLQPLTIDQYNEYRARETSVQWGNVITVGLGIAACFIPGGPIVATLVGAGIGMFPAVYRGVTTGEWDAGMMVKGAIVGGIGGRLGFSAPGATTSLTQAVTRGAVTGGATSVVGETWDMTPLPGGDGSFDVERIVINTAVGATSGGLGYGIQSRGATPDGPDGPLALPAGPQRLALPPGSGRVPGEPPVNVLPSSGNTYVVTPRGTTYDIPQGWSSRVADNGKGIVFQQPGATGNANSIRIMEPTAKYPDGYMRYYNSGGQPLDPAGKPGPQSTTHIPETYQGDLPAWPR